VIIFLLLIFAPIGVSAARCFWMADGRGNWQTADRSSAGLLPPPSARPEALIRVYGARTVRRRSIFAVHTWIVVNERGAATYGRFEINFLGALFGFDLRRPALKLPGIGRLGMTAGLRRLE
jgi:hypothetical protein